MDDSMARRARPLAIAALAAALAAALGACSGSAGGSGSNASATARTSAPAAAASASASSAKASSAPAASSLAGTWSGHYSGAFNGTFRLTWRQSGTHLRGTIHISDPGQSMPINGIVKGSSIRFGTVGSTAITYSGTISGSSMSGTYQVHSPNGAVGGPWNAARS